MLRLLLAIIAGVAIAGTLLLMRQQRLELQHDCNRLHDAMLDEQKQLWRQQVQIAAAVAPGALKAVLADHELRTAPEGEVSITAWDELMSSHLGELSARTASARTPGDAPAPTTAGSTDWSLLE